MSTISSGCTSFTSRQPTLRYRDLLADLDGIGEGWLYSTGMARMLFTICDIQMRRRPLELVNQLPQWSTHKECFRFRTFLVLAGHPSQTTRLTVRDILFGSITWIF